MSTDRKIKVTKRTEREPLPIVSNEKSGIISGEVAPARPLDSARIKQIERIERQMHYLIGQLQDLKTI